MEPLTTSLPFVDSAVAMRPGHVLELCGPSGAGKTELLTQAAATCVLPKRHGGAAAPALFVDLDGCFDALRLVQVLDARVQGGQGGIGSPSGEVSSAEVLEEALGRFYLVQCHDSLEFLAALRAARAGSLAPENFRHFPGLLEDLHFSTDKLIHLRLPRSQFSPLAPEPSPDRSPVRNDSQAHQQSEPRLC